ncbi:retinol dehydrogenase 11-like [Daphnia carinata]|uniref:retinol dehydrogenase 11-like n=1 Tax=Daphnia carinata TaxID=120202 RepID=UPI00257B9C81|nr:retinol dehydrogenase 11-like [Daphnia carinata]
MLVYLWSLPLLVRVALLVLSILVCLKVHFKLKHGVCTSQNKMTGKIVIITGANTGIGKETAIDLAKRGARVILACRDIRKADAAKDDIVRESGNNDVIVRHLDLASLKSVRKFAADILDSETRVDVLINNAGCVTTEKKLTGDGLEYQMQTNHFGHFLLTNLLLGLMKKSAPSRIINVSSTAYSFIWSLDVNNLNSELHYSGYSFYNMVYYYSKISQILCTRHLASLVRDSGVTVNCLCPGPVKTGIFRNANSWFFILLGVLYPFIFKTPKEGAETSIHLAVADEVANVTGEFFSDCKINKTNKLASDLGLAKKVWEKSEIYVDLKPEERHY